ncbi:MAG: hypothetical protein PHT31_00780 [Candidatus Omnitrophica bacterium]|nr:hypothetical protein [Candidatus Omnitrophota bacterium]MDD5652679.1 hypothetical protein [Candidatus Omnitrophota bacterium]
MKISSYEWFLNREKGRACLVAGVAPSITDFPFQKFKGVYLTCGDGALRLRDLFDANYWVVANDVFPVPGEHSEIINKFKKTVFIFSDSVACSRKNVDTEIFDKELEVDWFAFDQRHFNGSACRQGGASCCKLTKLYPQRLTLQEYMKKQFNRQGCYSSGSTVAVHALAFAILLGCNPIYLQGIEIPVYADEYKYKPDAYADSLLPFSPARRPDLRKLFNFISVVNLGKRKIKGALIRSGFVREKSPFFRDIPQILEDFNYLLSLAGENGISIFNLSKTSTLNKVKNLKYLEPAQIC